MWLDHAFSSKKEFTINLSRNWWRWQKHGWLVILLIQILVTDHKYTFEILFNMLLLLSFASFTKCPLTHSLPLVQINKKQFEKVLSYIEHGKREGAMLLTGGNALDRNGYFIEPTYSLMSL